MTIWIGVGLEGASQTTRNGSYESPKPREIQVTKSHHIVRRRLKGSFWRSSYVPFDECSF